MANICSFLGKIVGKEEEVKEVYNYFSEDYSYMRDQKGKFINPPKKPHFWRVD